MAILRHIRKVGAHSIQETRPYDTSASRPLVASDSQPLTRRKRKYRSLSSEQQTNQSNSTNRSGPQSKRQKTSSNSSCTTSTNSSSPGSSWSSWDRAERSYWDSLSRLRLTSNALRELNRRGALLRDNVHPNGDITITSEQHPTDITRFARHGGPDLSDIIKYPNPESVSSTPDSMPRNNKGKAKSGHKPLSIENKKDKRSSAYDGNFEQHLLDNNIHRANREQRAANHEEWAEVLERPRDSPSRTSDRSFKSFVRAADSALDEGEVMSRAFPKLVGNLKHASGQNVPFGHLERITDKIVIPQPDWYQGEIAGEGNRTLRERLDKAIIPSKRKDRPFLPTYFAEAKGPEGSFAVAQRQACHDGALGAKTLHKLQSLGGTETYDGNAYAASAIYHGEGDLKIYTHHMTQPRGPGTQPHTHMTPLMSIGLTNSPRYFREGRTAFRNVADKTHEYRVQFLQDANRRNRIISPPPPTIVRRSSRKPLSCQAPVAESESSGSDTNESSDDEASDDGRGRESSRAHLKRKGPRPRSVVSTPDRPAKKGAPPKSMLRRRKRHDSSESDASSSSEEEVPRKGRSRRTEILTMAPGRLASRQPSPRRGLRPRARTGRY